MLCSLALPDEPFRQILLSTKVDLIWCTTPEDGARDLLIVLGDVELDETPHRRSRTWWRPPGSALRNGKLTLRRVEVVQR
jgi:hypothetical protein